MSQGKKAVDTFLSILNNDDLHVYKQLIDILNEYGYLPQHKKKIKGLVIAFSNPVHNRVIANMGIREKCTEPFFGLRFPACIDYSDKFANVIRERILTRSNYLARCSQCNFCKGDKYSYTYKFPDGIIKASCGAYILEIPDVSENDIDEIKRLLEVQHKYFMEHYSK